MRNGGRKAGRQKRMKDEKGGRLHLAPEGADPYTPAMVASLLIPSEESQDLANLMRPEPLPDGSEPEGRLVVCGLSWDRYLAFDQALGDDRPSPRLYYLNGELEIMTTSGEHERVKKWIGDLMAVFFEEAGTEIMPRGQATMRAAL